MPLEGAKFYGPKTGYGSETAYYYVEVLPGEPSEVTKDGIRYKLDHKDTSPGTGYSVSKEDQYPLTGYTFNKNVSTRTILLQDLVHYQIIMNLMVGMIMNFVKVKSMSLMERQCQHKM